MIKLNIEDYCQDCPMFEAVTDKLYANCTVLTTYVTCKNKEICNKIKIYLEAKQDEEH